MMPLKLELVSEIKSYLSADLGAAAEKIDQLIVASSVEEELSEGDKNQISEIILDYFRAIDKENHLSIATLFQFCCLLWHCGNASISIGESYWRTYGSKRV